MIGTAGNTGRSGRSGQADAGSAAGMSTGGLVAAAARGSEDAWNELVDRYTPLVAAVVTDYGLDGVDAADVNQTVWLRLVEWLGKLRHPSALPAWIVTTTRRECLRVRAAGHRTHPFDPWGEADRWDLAAPPPVDTGDTPDMVLLQAERDRVLREGFTQLSLRCQELLGMLFTDPPASYREVTGRLGIPSGSIGPTQARCLQKLRDCPAITAYLDADRADEGGKEGPDDLATG